MIHMAIPSIISQIINILYNIVDRIYIGHISGVGAAALTGGKAYLPDYHPDRKGDTHIYGGNADLRHTKWNLAYLSGARPGKDFLIYSSFDKGDPFGALGIDLP